jgi:choline-sulfatase
MPSFRPPPGEDPPPPEPLGARAGSLLGAATLAAMLAAIPATVRVAPLAPPSCGALGAWLALAACALLPSVAAVAIVRGAREGTRTLAGDDAALAVWAVAAWAMTSFLALAAYGALLRATTHHHGLAGVTFAIGGVAIGAVLALVVRRLTAAARAADPWGRAALLAASLVALGAALAVVAIRVARAGGVEPLLDRAAFVDLVAFLVAVGGLSRRAFVRIPGLARGGLPLALGVLALGGALLARNPLLLDAIRERAPEMAPLAALAAPR